MPSTPSSRTDRRHGKVYDVVIRGARVVDGTGGPSSVSDVAVRAGKIAAIGPNLPRADEEVDGAGSVLAPGFIDVHTHAENIIDQPKAECFTRQGVTTVVAGNCGSSERDLGAFFRKLQAAGISPNFASLIGHNTVREEAMKGSFDRPPTADEMAAMRQLVDRAMRAGAVGLSTGLIYLPGAFAKLAEVVEVARVAAAHGGIYTSHMRSEGDRIYAALDEVFDIGRGASIRCQVSHIKLSGNNNWGQADRVLGVIAKARSEGIAVTQDQYVYTASSTGIAQLAPAWVQEGEADDYRSRIADPAVRAKVAQEMKAKLAVRGKDSYDWVNIASCPSDRSLNGLTLPQAAQARRGSDALDAQIDLVLDLLREGGAAAIFHGICEDDLRVFLLDPHTMIGSDSGVREFGKDVPHPRGYGNNARVLGKYVRELGLLTLEEAVRKMTLLPATVFALRDRGQVRVGAWADLVLFDPDTVRDTATFEQPHQYAVGFRHVLVNGTMVIREGVHTGALPGKPLRHRSASGRS